MAGFLLWLLLLVFCWPLALLALVLYPIVWLLLLPLRLVGITVGAVFAFLGALLMLPALAIIVLGLLLYGCGDSTGTAKTNDGSVRGTATDTT